MSILEDNPTHFLGFKLIPFYQVIFCFLLPAIIKTVVYIIDVATSIAMVQRHFKEGDIKWASLTIAIIYAPSFAFFINIMVKPNTWKNYFTPVTSKGIQWLLFRILQIFLYPGWVIYSYSKQIFWSVEALSSQDEQRELAIQEILRPSVNNFLVFLQAFLQSAPQAILQMYILLILHEHRAETDKMQVVCIQSSLIMVAITIVSFQRFESQQIAGRQIPWEVIPIKESSSLHRYSSIKILRNTASIIQPEEINNTKCDDENIQQTLKNEATPIELDKNQQPNSTQHIIQVTEKIQSESEESLSEIVDETGTPYLKPRVFPQVKKLKNCNDDNSDISSSMSAPDENLETTVNQNKSNIILTLDNMYNHQDTFHSMQADNILESPIAASDIIPSSPISRHSIELPSRKKTIKGLERDDPLGKFIAFLWWYFFIASRFLAITAFSQFYPYPTLGIVMTQYVITLTYLIRSKKQYDIVTIGTQLFVSYLLLFCLIEYKVKFKRVFISYASYSTFIHVESVIISTVWFTTGLWDGFWYNYVYIVSLGCIVVSVLSMLFYLMMFKPSAIYFYEDEYATIKKQVIF